MRCVEKSVVRFYGATPQRRINAKPNDYVFPGIAKGKHIVAPRKKMIKVTAMSWVDFTLHDLKRTFITIAEPRYPGLCIKIAIESQNE